MTFHDRPSTSRDLPYHHPHSRDATRQVRTPAAAITPSAQGMSAQAHARKAALGELLARLESLDGLPPRSSVRTSSAGPASMAASITALAVRCFEDAPPPDAPSLADWRRAAQQGGAPQGGGAQEGGGMQGGTGGAAGVGGSHRPGGSSGALNLAATSRSSSGVTRGVTRGNALTPLGEWRQHLRWYGTIVQQKSSVGIPPSARASSGALLGNGAADAHAHAPPSSSSARGGGARGSIFSLLPSRRAADEKQPELARVGTWQVLTPREHGQAERYDRRGSCDLLLRLADRGGDDASAAAVSGGAASGGGVSGGASCASAAGGGASGGGASGGSAGGGSAAREARTSYLDELRHLDRQLQTMHPAFLSQETIGGLTTADAHPRLLELLTLQVRISPDLPVISNLSLQATACLISPDLTTPGLI